VTVLYGDEPELDRDALAEPEELMHPSTAWQGSEQITFGAAQAIHEETFPTRHCEDGC
jgi:hypothetical protein